jgi:hypothetical protein
MTACEGPCCARNSRRAPSLGLSGDELVPYTGTTTYGAQATRALEASQLADIGNHSARERV